MYRLVAMTAPGDLAADRARRMSRISDATLG